MVVNSTTDLVEVLRRHSRDDDCPACRSTLDSPSGSWRRTMAQFFALRARRPGTSDSGRPNQVARHFELGG